MWIVVKLGATNLLQFSLKEAPYSPVSGEKFCFCDDVPVHLNASVCVCIKHDVRNLTYSESENFPDDICALLSCSHCTL